MIGISKNKVSDIPFLTVVEQNNIKKALPTIFYSHGFTSAKEHNLPVAYLLAESGFRVVLPDSKYHGERQYNNKPMERELAFWDIVIQNIDELEIIKNQLMKEGLIEDHKIGLAGTSMGGITTAGALAMYDWIDVAAILMGTPKITDYAEMLIKTITETEGIEIPEQEITATLTKLEAYDLSRQPEKMNERPLLFWHGTNDSVVPIDFSYEFYKKERKIYQNEHHIKFLKEENRSHKVSRYAILETVKWFETHLIHHK